LLQEQPPPAQEKGNQPQAAPKKKAGKKGARRRAGASPVVIEPKGQPEDIKPPTGPMRVELLSVSETRVHYEGQPPQKPAKSSLRLQAKLTGERLAELVAVGRLVLEELIDDTGAMLAAPQDVDPAERNATRPLRMSRQILVKGFVGLQANTKVPSRAARQITKANGWVNVAYATETEEIMIDNPLQYADRYIEHPRLAELGFKVRVVNPGKEINQKRDGRGIGLQFDGYRKHMRRVEFFDAWMKPMYARDRTVKTPEGQEYIFYGVVVGQLDADSQMLLRFYPEIEEAQIRYTFENIELP
jgi:hypothetical protein